MAIFSSLSARRGCHPWTSAWGFVASACANCLIRWVGPPAAQAGGVCGASIRRSVVDATPSATFLGIAAETVGLRRARDGHYWADIRSDFREIGDTMMRRPVSWLLRGSAESRACKERDGQNESERHRRFEVSVHRDLLVSEAPFAEALSFYAPPSSTIGLSIAVVLLMRPRRPSLYSKGLGKNC